MLRGFTRKIEPLNILSDTDVQRVHTGALEVLEKTGVNFLDTEALSLLKENGCRVDMEGKRARIPAWLSEESIRSTPSVFFMKARDSRHDLLIGENRLYFLAGAGMRIVDLDTGETRPATLKELDEASTGWMFLSGKSRHHRYRRAPQREGRRMQRNRFYRQ